MSRPKPNVLLEQEIVDREKQKHLKEEILEADAIYAVFYDDTPINLRVVPMGLNQMLSNQDGPKYKKVSFSNSGHAINLAEKLNKIYKTDKFSVYKLVKGDKI